MNKSYTYCFIFLAGLLAFSSCKNDDNKEVTIEKVERRTIIEKVSANGKIQPETDVKISAEVSGKIKKIHVKEGDSVKEGDLLITINPDLLTANRSRANAAVNNSKANLASSKARLSQANAQYANAEKTYARSQELFNQGVISQAEMDQAEATYQSSRADQESAAESVNAAKYSVQSAQASATEASDNLSRTTIFAPTDGVITALQVEEGETVLGTIQMTGTELLRVSKVELMEVDVDVNESDIVRVAIGDTAEVEVDAYLDRVFMGLVTEIANAANNSTAGMSTDQVTDFSVKIRILESSYKDLVSETNGMQSPFRTGMSATVDIMTARVENALSVPIESVTTRTDTTAAKLSFKERRDKSKEMEAKKIDMDPVEVVFVVNGSDALIKPVKTGVQDSRYIQILSGLSADDEVITGPYKTVSRNLESGDSIERKEGNSDDDED